MCPWSGHWHSSVEPPKDRLTNGSEYRRQYNLEIDHFLTTVTNLPTSSQQVNVLAEITGAWASASDLS